MAVQHNPQRLVDRGLRGHREDPAGHDFVHLDVGAPGPEPPQLLRHGKGRGHQLAEGPVSEHSDDPSALGHRQVPDVMGLEQLPGFPQAGVGPDRDDLGGHVAFD